MQGNVLYIYFGLYIKAYSPVEPGMHSRDVTRPMCNDKPANGGPFLVQSAKSPRHLFALTGPTIPAHSSERNRCPMNCALPLAHDLVGAGLSFPTTLRRNTLTAIY